MNFIRCCVIIYFEYILKISTSYSRFNNYFEFSHFTTAISNGLLMF
ncbi:hypothetical protein EC07798_1718 [Escherichia coli 07798]|nr:hypothetical protein EC07798_1718 [Escherichia coli 07798]